MMLHQYLTTDAVRRNVAASNRILPSGAKIWDDLLCKSSGVLDEWLVNLEGLRGKSSGFMIVTLNRVGGKCWLFIGKHCKQQNFVLRDGMGRDLYADFLYSIHMGKI